MPVNWDIMMENTMDPSHANWLHDGLFGNWDEAAPLNMHVTDAPSDPNQVRCCALYQSDCPVLQDIG